MVYTGKPSRGCQTCKTRRIKCDEKRPICSQCHKSNRVCPGYPDEFDLIFRNENVALERKARKASGSSSKNGSQGSTPVALTPEASPAINSSTTPFPLAERSITPTRTPSDASASRSLFPGESYFQTFLWDQAHEMPPTLTIAPEVEATAFFFKNFVSPQQAESMRGFLELLIPLYKETSSSSALHMSIGAVSLAACARFPGRESLCQKAVHMYGKALRQVNADIQDPVKARSDETVLATLVFSLYETIMSTDHTIKAWANHVDGAVALTKLRGDSQFKHPMSRAVFRAVRTVMITSCVQLSKPIDPFPSPHGWTGSPLSEENAANRLSLICIDLPNIRARATSLQTLPPTLTSETEARALLTYAQTVDANLQNWSHTLPEDWYFRTAGYLASIADDIDVATAPEWPGPQHVYEDVHIANIINDYRVCRIFCQSVILACINILSPQNPHTAPEYKNAAFIIQTMVDEICACVPFHMRYDMQHTPKQLGQDESAAEAIGGYFLVWPLYVAANAEVVPKRQRDWLQGRLFHIGNTFGLSAAQVLVLARRHVLTCGPMFSVKGVEGVGL